MSERIKNIAGGFAGSFGLVHSSLCPVHGLLPNIAYVATGFVSSEYSETALGKFGDSIHTWTIDAVADGLSHLPLYNSSDQHHDIHETHTHDHAHHYHEHSVVQEHAEALVLTLNVVLMMYGGYRLLKYAWPGSESSCNHADA